MRIEGREVAARAGRNPSTQRRKFEALRVVTQRQLVRGELSFERGPAGTGLDASREGDRVHLEHAVQAPEINGDHTPVGRAGASFDAADDARSAPFSRAQKARSSSM